MNHSVDDYTHGFSELQVNPINTKRYRISVPSFKFDTRMHRSLRGLIHLVVIFEPFGARVFSITLMCPDVRRHASRFLICFISIWVIRYSVPGDFNTLRPRQMATI